jgi:hypothetical protein
MNAVQRGVFLALRAVIDNAMWLPDGNAQFPSSLGNALGEALTALSEWEDLYYGDESTDKQSIRKMYATPWEKEIESLMGAADALYCSIFHEVIIPGGIYLMKPLSPNGMDYCPQTLLNEATTLIITIRPEELQAE